MKKSFGKQAMRIMAAALVMVLLMVPMAFGEQSAWDCPECGRTGNLWNYCGNCAHPAPWTKEEGFDEEKAYDAVLKQYDAVLKRLEEMDGSIGAINSNAKTYYQDITFEPDSIISAGTIGSRAYTKAISPSNPEGYSVAGVFIISIGSTYECFASASFISDKISVSVYRAVNTQISIANATVVVRVIYKKIQSK